MGANAWVVSNRLTGLAAAAFTWSAGANDATRSRLCDGMMNQLYVNGAVVASGINVVVDLGTALACTGAAALNSNCAVQKTDAALRIRGADNLAMTVNVVTAKAASTLNTAAMRNKDHVLQFASVTKRYWEFLWTWTGNVLDFAVGELFLLNAQTTLARKSIYGAVEARDFRVSEVGHYNGSSTTYFEGGPLRSKRLPYSDMTSAELEGLFAIPDATKGGAKPFLWIESYEATATAAAVDEQEVLYGKIGPAFEFSNPDYRLFTPNELVIKSLGRQVGA